MKKLRSLFLLFLAFFKTSSWCQAESTKWPNDQWRIAVEKVVRENLSSFEAAKDKNDFCPGYSAATERQKVNCWVTLVRATVKMESNDRPSTSYREPMGMNSVGLLQLSKGECPNAPTDAALKNPEANLICGTKKMAKFIKAGGRVEGKSGAGKYWSVLRKPYSAYGMNLGKVGQIQAITKNYKAVSTGSDAPTNRVPASNHDTTIVAAKPKQKPPATANPPIVAKTKPNAPSAKPTEIAGFTDPDEEEEESVLLPEPKEQPKPKAEKKAKPAPPVVAEVDEQEEEISPPANASKRKRNKPESSSNRRPANDSWSSWKQREPTWIDKVFNPTDRK